METASPADGKRGRIRAWIWVGICTLAIFLVIPFARAVQKFVAARWGRSLFIYLVLAALMAGMAAVVYLLVFRLKIRSPARYAWLAAIAAVYVYATLQRWKSPEEAVHFIEYGALGFFLFRALSYTVRDVTIYLDAALLGSMVGFADEIIQWIVPERLWDFRDAGFNALAVALFQAALWLGIKPRAVSEAVGPRSIRRTSWLLAANLVLIGICLSNTPERVLWYGRKIPFLAPLARQEVMHDFNMAKHQDPAVGTFYSRLSREELLRTDNEKSVEYGSILRDWQDKKYDEFLWAFSATNAPFLHEMRVRLFRRDRKLQEAEKAKDAARRKEALFIAFKENLILETYFAKTLEASELGWPKDKKAEISGQVDSELPYDSPVSAAGGGFLSKLSETQAWGGILVILVGLAAFNTFYGRRHRHRNAPVR